MIVLVMGSVMYLAAAQASIDGPRAAFSTCLKQASAKALGDKVAGDAFPGYAKAACTGEADKLKNALVSFDVKNGVKRAQASSDADAQLDDYIVGSTENYTARLEASTPKQAVAAAPAPAATPSATPAPTPATAPK